jgi:imidazolonepropionase-like amidohydrolase
MNRVVIAADRLWDGTGAASVQRPVLSVVGDRIERFDTTVADSQLTFPGCTILPGLIDTHVHLVMSALDTNEAIIAQVQGETDAQLLDRALANARAALGAGITTLRDCGGRRTVVQQARDRIRRGEAEGPDVLACGAPITTTRGHCCWLELIADTREQVRNAAHRMLDEGADFLKVMATGGNMTASSDPMKAQYDADTLMLIADFGRAAGKHSAAHVLSRSALPAVVAANYRTIEHCDWRVEEFRYEFQPELARRMIDQGQFAGLTMSGLARRAFLPEVNKLDISPVKRLDARFECERRMIDFGVRYTIHSDAGVRMCPIDRFDLGLRAAQIELRLTASEILRAVTATAAEVIGLPDRGTLTPGRRADLIVVEGDPLADLACIGKVRAVMKAGRWYRAPASAITSTTQTLEESEPQRHRATEKTKE